MKYLIITILVIASCCTNKPEYKYRAGFNADSTALEINKIPINEYWSGWDSTNIYIDSIQTGSDSFSSITPDTIFVGRSLTDSNTILMTTRMHDKTVWIDSVKIYPWKLRNDSIFEFRGNDSMFIRVIYKQ